MGVRVPNAISVLIALMINIISSVGIIFINKQLVFARAGFKFGCALTIIHFIATYVACWAVTRAQLSDRKYLRWRSVLPLALAFCGYVVFNNLSLLYNSVTVYQISKIFCTPVIVFLEHRKYKRSESRATLRSLVLVCLGSFITVWSDTTFSLYGAMWCILAVGSNSFYTVWGKSFQVDLAATPIQILQHQALMSSVILIMLSPVLENTTELMQYRPSVTAVMCVLLSCIFAFGVNFSFFFFVGKTSALSMNIVGYLKTSLVFIVGFWFRVSEPSVLNVVGISLTLLGLALYSLSKAR